MMKLEMMSNCTSGGCGAKIGIGDLGDILENYQKVKMINCFLAMIQVMMQQYIK